LHNSGHFGVRGGTLQAALLQPVAEDEADEQAFTTSVTLHEVKAAGQSAAPAPGPAGAPPAAKGASRQTTPPPGADDTEGKAAGPLPFVSSQLAGGAGAAAAGGGTTPFALPTAGIPRIITTQGGQRSCCPWHDG
jgi:hypothetical protein